MLNLNYRVVGVRLVYTLNEWIGRCMFQLTQEIVIHRSLRHNHIVGFHSFFDDTDNVYILLELCRRRVCDSLRSLHIYIHVYYIISLM